MAAIKTPISQLQEFAVAHGLDLPSYDPSNPITAANGFTCTCTVSNQRTLGVGFTKKEAKHNSADKMLRNLGCNTNNTKYSKVSGGIVGSFVNYVGKLNEHATSVHVPNAEYEPVTIVTSSGEFFAKCTYLGKEIVGSGTTKREAKQQAARYMLEKINVLPKVSIENPVLDTYLSNSSVSTSNPLTENFVSIKTESDTTWRSQTIYMATTTKTPVSELQEFVVARGLAFPSYDHVISPNGFICRCTISNQQTVGLGSAKKEAKHHSAHKMLEILRSKSKLFSEKVQPLSTSLRHEDAESTLPKNNELLHLSHMLPNGWIPKSEVDTDIANRLTSQLQLLEDNCLGTQRDNSVCNTPFLTERDNSDELKQLLQHFNVKYTLRSVPSQHPYRIVALVVNDTKFTVMGYGSSNTEATNNAMKEMITIKRNEQDL